MKKSENKKNDQLTNAMNNFQDAIKLLEETVENLHQTEKNMQISKDNFNRTLKMQKDMKTSSYSYHGIQTFEEKLDQLNGQYLTVAIDNQFQNDVIIFQSIEKNSKVS